MEFIKHTVKAGDNLSKIAAKYGFPGRDWDKIYAHPKNAAFRKLRPDPDLIEPKDVLFVPKTPGKEIDAELKSLNAMRIKMETMPLSIKKLLMETKRMGKEAARIHKSGAMVQADIQMLRGMQVVHKSEVTSLDQIAARTNNDAKSGVTDSPKSFAIFQQRQAALANLINTLKTIDEADKHLRRDPKKALFAIGLLNKDVAKIAKLTADWTKSHNDAVKEIDARIKQLNADRKDTF